MKKTVIFLVALFMAAGMFAADATFNLATYNIRQLNDGDVQQGDGWSRRMPVLAKLIQFHQFDIFGTEEGFRQQLNQLRDSLPGYAYIGAGRDDGKEAGEHSAIFYRTDLFDVVDHGDFWLSEHPDRPGLGWDAACVRICTWGHFRHKPSGKEFLYFNLHMDHIGVVARAESARLIRKKIKEFGSGLPTFLSGDFNVDQHSPSYACVLEDGTFLDSYDLSPIKYITTGTYNGYRTDGFSPSRIDHIFVTPGVKVSRYGVLTDTYRAFEPSADASGNPGKPADGLRLDPNNESNVTSFADNIDTSDKIDNGGNAPAELKMHRVVPHTPSDHFPVLITVTLPDSGSTTK